MRRFSFLPGTRCSYALGTGWHVIEQYADVLQYVVIAVAVIAVAAFIAFRVRAALRDGRGGAASGDAIPDSD